MKFILKLTTDWRRLITNGELWERVKLQDIWRLSALMINGKDADVKYGRDCQDHSRTQRAVGFSPAPRSLSLGLKKKKKSLNTSDRTL